MENVLIGFSRGQETELFFGEFAVGKPPCRNDEVKKLRRAGEVEQQQ